MVEEKDVLADNDKFELYVHITPSNKLYFGISNNAKVRWHNGLGYKYNKHFWNAIQKYGWENIKHIIIADDLSFEEAGLLEYAFIQKFNTQNRDFGYNFAEGGCINRGYHHTDEYKRHSSEIRIGKYTGELNGFYGKHHTDETKIKCGNSFKGKHHTESAKKKISDAMKNRKVSDETRKKLSEKAKNRVYTNEYRQKCSDRMKGNVPWNLGMKMSDEHKAKLRENHVGTTGKKFSEETKQKMREAALKREAKKRMERANDIK